MLTHLPESKICMHNTRNSLDFLIFFFLVVAASQFRNASFLVANVDWSIPVDSNLFGFLTVHWDELATISCDRDGYFSIKDVKISFMDDKGAVPIWKATFCMNAFTYIDSVTLTTLQTTNMQIKWMIWTFYGIVCCWSNNVTKALAVNQSAAIKNQNTKLLTYVTISMSFHFSFVYDSK